MAIPSERLAQDHPDQIGVRDPRRAMSWAELDEYLNRAVNALLGEDLGPDRRIAIMAENSVETLLVHVARLLAGVSAVPVNFHLTAGEVAYILEDSGAAKLFVGPEQAEVGLAAAQKVEGVGVVGWRVGATDGVASWEDLCRAASRRSPPTDLPPGRNLMYTSGTTGFPKGTEDPPAGFVGGDSITEHVERLRADPFARLGSHLAVGPLYHSGPLTAHTILAAGVPVVVLERFDAVATLAAIQTYRIATSIMVPTHFVRLLALPENTRSSFDVSSLREVVHTGAPCPVDVKHRMIEWWGPVLTDAYGATEVGVTTSISALEWLERPGSVGQAAAPFTALVVDEEGHELPAFQEGRLCFEDPSGHGVVYHRDPERSASATIRPGVFTLGEIGYIDDEGYVFITDRASDMVVSGGVNLYPAELERILIQHPAVTDVAVIGVPNEDMGEELKALVVARSPVTGQDLLVWCHERLARFKAPRSFEFVDDLGRDAMGKLDKRRLRARY